jgi:hydroxypyruvate reductase
MDSRMVDLASPDARRDLIARAFEAGLRSVAPDEAVREALTRTADGFAVAGEPVAVAGRVVVVAIGKAAVPMAVAARDVLGDRIDRGYVLTKDGHAAGAPADFEVWEASHPVPDERGIHATRAILAGVAGMGADDVVLALISGGGSALFEAPVDGLTLADMQATTDLLLRAGAPIQHLNAVRSELSQVKGGGFRRRIGPPRTISLILSDVLGNPPGVIASGPTVLREPDPDGALRALDRYELRRRVPGAVRRHLEGGARGRSPAKLDTSHDVYRIVGDNDRFVRAVRGELERAGLSVSGIWREREGEAREQAVAWVDALEAAQSEAIVGGGELTVTVRGDGSGGRNTELALAAAIELDRRGITASVASLASDGQDGGVDAAGAIVDERTVARLRAQDIDPWAALDRNDSGGALGAIGALLAPGPTGTNVNDVYIGIHGRSTPE